MKVLSIVPYNIFSAKLGGQKGIALFNKYLAKECALYCVTVKSNQPSYAEGYTLYPLLGSASFRYINPFNFFLVKRLVQELKITHLILEHPYFGWLGILVQWATGVKLVVHSHNIENTRWKSVGKWWWKILFRYEGAIHRAADYNFFINEADRQYALKAFRLEERKSAVITYGIEWNSTPTLNEKQRCREQLVQQYGLSADTNILLFNGTLGYPPNLQALQVILERLNPLLLSSSLTYKIFICGSGLPENMQGLATYANKNIIYAGFVDDITTYFKGADLFLNPVIEGGGIKTKLVEALAYGTRTVSTVNGSIGVSKEDAGDLLQIVDDGNWPAFATAIITSCAVPAPALPPAFFEKFYWVNIARKAAAFMQT